jgi:hypothetical protein
MLPIFWMYMLLLPAGQTGEAWEPSEKQCSFGTRGASDGEVFSLLLLVWMLNHLVLKLYVAAGKITVVVWNGCVSAAAVNGAQPVTHSPISCVNKRLYTASLIKVMDGFGAGHHCIDFCIQIGNWELWGTALQAGRSRDRFPIMSLEFFIHNRSGRTMALGSTPSLTEMSTRDISWDNGGRCVGLTTLPLSCAVCLKIWEPQLPGTLRACEGL